MVRDYCDFYNEDFDCVHPCVHDFFRCTADMVTIRANTNRNFFPVIRYEVGGLYLFLSDCVT